MSQEQINEVLDSIIRDISPFLQEMGLAPQKKRAFIKHSEECTQGLVFQARYIKGGAAGYVELCPNITFEKVEKRASFLKGEKYRKGWPTVAGNIGNLQQKKEFIEWPITLTTDIANLTKIMVTCIESIAKPFWGDYDTLEKLIKGFEDLEPRLNITGKGYTWRLLAAYCLIGKPELAIELLDGSTFEWMDKEQINAVKSRIQESGGTHDL